MSKEHTQKMANFAKSILKNSKSFWQLFFFLWVQVVAQAICLELK